MHLNIKHINAFQVFKYPVVEQNQNGPICLLLNLCSNAIIGNYWKRHN